MFKNKIEFYKEVGRLKSLPRTGWVKRKIPNPETVAAHMYRSQFIAHDLAEILGECSKACSQMMMIHDLPEARAGDITPSCGISCEEKARREMLAATELFDLAASSEFLDIFQEYEESSTLRARLCHDADQLECLVQVLEYGQKYPHLRPSLEEFWPYALNRITTEVGLNLYKELKAEKPSIVLSAKQNFVFKL